MADMTSFLWDLTKSSMLCLLCLILIRLVVREIIRFPHLLKEYWENRNEDFF